jgi:hypothetical protein
MWIHRALIKPPKGRTMKEVQEIKVLCDQYYHNPPISLEEIKNAHLHAIYILNVDKATVQETDPLDYLEKSKNLSY